jgi:transposase
VRKIKTPSRKCDHVVRYGDNLGGVFSVATRVSYPAEIKLKAVEMRLAGVPVREVMVDFHQSSLHGVKTEDNFV